MVEWDKEIEYVVTDPQEEPEVLPAKVVGRDIRNRRIVLGERSDGTSYVGSFYEDGTNDDRPEDSETVLTIRNKKRKVWVNLYEGGSSYDYGGMGGYSCKEDADRGKMPNRIAVVEIEV